jgi:competence protein ComEA
MWMMEPSRLREKRWMGAVGVLALIVVGVLGYQWWGGDASEAEPIPEGVQVYQPAAEEKESEESNQIEGPVELVVDVKGAVKQPGVYRLPPGSRVEDAVKEAGGPTKQADMDRVNLAQPLTDGMALRVPAEGEEAGPFAGDLATSTGGAGEAAAVNLNTATQEELQSLTGIGPAKAEAILRYREENGPFGSVDELVQVSGIGEKTLEQLRDQVTVH